MRRGGWVRPRPPSGRATPEGVGLRGGPLRPRRWAGAGTAREDRQKTLEESGKRWGSDGGGKS